MYRQTGKFLTHSALSTNLAYLHQALTLYPHEHTVQTAKNLPEKCSHVPSSRDECPYHQDTTQVDPAECPLQPTILPTTARRRQWPESSHEHETWVYRYDQKYYRNTSARADFCSSLRQIIRALQHGAVQSKNNSATARCCKKWVG